MSYQDKLAECRAEFEHIRSLYIQMSKPQGMVKKTTKPRPRPKPKTPEAKKQHTTREILGVSTDASQLARAHVAGEVKRARIQLGQLKKRLAKIKL